MESSYVNLDGLLEYINAKIDWYYMKLNVIRKDDLTNYEIERFFECQIGLLIDLKKYLLNEEFIEYGNDHELFMKKYNLKPIDEISVTFNFKFEDLIANEEDYVPGTTIHLNDEDKSTVKEQTYFEEKFQDIDKRLSNIEKDLRKIKSRELKKEYAIQEKKMKKNRKGALNYE